MKIERIMLRAFNDHLYNDATLTDNSIEDIDSHVNLMIQAVEERDEPINNAQDAMKEICSHIIMNDHNYCLMFIINFGYNNLYRIIKEAMDEAAKK